MTTLTRYVILILAMTVLSTFLSYAEESDVWSSDFSKRNTGDWEGYGGDSTIDVVKEKTTGKYVLMTTFSDSSPDAWAHRGVRIKFRDAIPREKFNHIYFNYKIDHPVKCIGYFLADEDNNAWRVFYGPVINGN